ncbi:MAG TPA: hypothetical protein VF519_10770 [Mycobacteriales bacterium]|jgi:cytoskeletal protein RodZ
MRTRLVPAALALALLAACGGDDPSPSASPSANGATTPVTTAPGTASATPSGGPGCPIQPGPAAGTTVITATVTGKKVDTARGTYPVKLGSNVRVAVTADTADEVHVHGYDKKQDTQPGCPTAIDLVANIAGTVEVELEEAGIQLFEIKAS